MPSFKNKNLKTGGADQDPQDAAAIPGELDRQLQSAAAEITRDAARVAAGMTNMDDSAGRFTATDPEGDYMRLVQGLLFHTVGYAHLFSLVLTRPYTERIVPRLLALFCDCFYREFFSREDRPGSYEYFKMVFTQDYLSFFREMEESEMLSLPPNEFVSRTVDSLLESAAAGSAEVNRNPAARDLVTEFVEKRAFLKISRVLLSF